MADIRCMSLNPALYVLAVTAVLTYFAVTTIMSVLAAHFHREKSVHDLVRQAKQAKLDYYHELAIRKGLIADDSMGGIDIEGDDDWQQDDADAPLGKIEPDMAADEEPVKQAA